MLNGQAVGVIQADTPLRKDCGIGQRMLFAGMLPLLTCLILRSLVNRTLQRHR